MISNERSFSHGQPSNGVRTPKPPVNEDTLKVERVQIERKMFILTLKENPRGRFLRITEEVNGRRDNVIVPSTGLEEFAKVVSQMADAASQLPSSNSNGSAS